MEISPEITVKCAPDGIEQRVVSAIIGRYARESEMPSGQELCLERAFLTPDLLIPDDLDLHRFTAQ